jgi:hypothetical protein
MSETLWALPVSLSLIMRGPFFAEHPKRECEISFTIEGDDGKELPISLHFGSVQVFKCTMLYSLGSIDRGLRKDSYGKVISLGDSKWLTEVRESYDRYCSIGHIFEAELRHLMITFDDGPCYEFICSTFYVQQ